MQGCLQASFFGGVVEAPFSFRDQMMNQKSTLNMLGLAFSAASDQFIMMSMAQVLQIPISRPIFLREINSRLYSTSAYFIGQTLAGMMLFFLYPMFTAAISYWFFGFADGGDLAGMFDWMVALAFPALVGSLWGFSFGTFFKSEMIAL